MKLNALTERQAKILHEALLQYKGNIEDGDIDMSEGELEAELNDIEYLRLQLHRGIHLLAVHSCTVCTVCADRKSWLTFDPNEGIIAE